jgi:hypothetical protein
MNDIGTVSRFGFYVSSFEFSRQFSIGLYGAYLALTGILMAVAPKSEKGDVTDQ